MARRQRECYLCGKSYQYCSTCSQDRTKPAFLAIFHNENCKNIFETCTNFNLELITKLEAQEALIECDLSDQANFKPYVQNDIERIFSADEPKQHGQAAKIDIVDKNVDTHEAVNKAKETK